MKVSVKDGKICNQKARRKWLEGFGEVRIIDGANGFGLDFVEEIESGFRSTGQGVGAVL